MKTAKSSLGINSTNCMFDFLLAGIRDWSRYNKHPTRCFVVLHTPVCKSFSSCDLGSLSQGLSVTLTPSCREFVPWRRHTSLLHWMEANAAITILTREIHSVLSHWRQTKYSPMRHQSCPKDF